MVGDGVGAMGEAVEVGSGRDAAALALPAFEPSREPVLLGLGGDVVPDDGVDEPIARITAAVQTAERIATMTAAFRDELVATAYREGSAEYTARLTHLPPAQRREWGARAMLAELACALRVPETTLSRRLARTAALAAFPRFRAANAAGAVSSWHCDVMLDVFGNVAEEAALAAADAALIGRALTATASDLRVSARRWRARHVPKTLDERRRNLADRRVQVSAADDDLCWLTALLPAVQAMAIYHRLSDVAAAVQGSGDDRTADQLRADAMCALLLASPGARTLFDDAADDEPVAAHGDSGSAVALANDERVATREADGRNLVAFGGVDSSDASALSGSAGRCARLPRDLAGIAPTVVLTVPALSLLGHGDEPADLEGFGPIDVETARELAALAPSFIRVLTHPETGAVLSVGRDRYRVPADLKTALAIRDETCRFPGCRRRAVRCDIDHALAWAHGGGTAIDNLEHLCRKHHRLKHEAGWAVTHDGGGGLTWISPVGLRYRDEPARHVWPPRPAPPPEHRNASPPALITAPSSGYPDEPPF